MKITGNKQAMPLEYEEYNSVGLLCKRQEFGLTKREYFAAVAMQGLMVHDDKSKQCKYLAAVAVEYADALIAELNKE